MSSWLEVYSTDSAKLQEIASEYKINPLAIEDCQNRDQRPKLDDYENHQLLVWFMLYEDTIHELQFLISENYLVMVPHDLPPEKSSWTEYLGIKNLEKDTWHLLYQALDKITDVTWAQTRVLFSQIDDFEQAMFESESDPRELMYLKKQLNKIDYAMGHLPSVAQQVRNLCPHKGDLKWKLRDLFDHSERINKSVEAYRSQIATTIELFWGLQSNKTNRQIKRLTLIASISVPTTFWASFWGMNFEFIPFNRPELFYLAIALMIASVALTFWLLVRKGYWAD